MRLALTIHVLEILAGIALAYTIDLGFLFVTMFGVLGLIGNGKILYRIKKAEEERIRRRDWVHSLRPKH